MGGSPGISTTVEPTWGRPGIPGGGGGPGGGEGDGGGGGAGGTPLLTSRVTINPASHCAGSCRNNGEADENVICWTLW